MTTRDAAEQALAGPLAVVFSYDESNAAVDSRGASTFGGEGTSYWQDRAEAVLDAILADPAARRAIHEATAEEAEQPARYPYPDGLVIPTPSPDDASVAGLRSALTELDDWLMHPKRSYSPHELSMEVHQRLRAALAAMEGER